MNFFSVKDKGWGVNYPYSQLVTELRRTHINVAESYRHVGDASCRQSPYNTWLTTDHSLDVGVDFAEGGKPENTDKNPRSAEETNYNNSAYMSPKFEN